MSSPSLPRKAGVAAAFAVFAFPLAVAVPASAGTASVVESAPAARPRPGTAVNLRITPAVRRALGDSYFAAVRRHHPKQTRARVVGPNEVYYGKIVGSAKAGTVFYAAGETGFSNDPVSRQDGPHVWRKPSSGEWAYLGDTGDWLCGLVPDKLLKVWGRLRDCV